ncbi:hypothetical protein BTA51_18975 [Hahella sp. CCB-MM4]|uniref:hypothetical protein n=1 Tax=Hahella sp. (strain CCB-MM4) TaxID=1926491 RepID=UPI000B9C58D7|nr:hypothetical protein [Hahella sp. CCB-MM4]OZG71726.1 hypothetical protein BTA51_18975 [Hahella sp. CCB-MM4]
METPGNYSKTKDPLRIRDRIYLNLTISDLTISWRKHQSVRFRCYQDGSQPADDIDVYLADSTRPVIRIAHNLLARYLHTGTDLVAETINRSPRNLFQRQPVGPHILRVCVEPGELDWSKINPIIQRNNDIALKVEEASYFAGSDPQKALAMYEDAVNDIYDLHFESPLASYWRRVQFPVNELSELLEKMGAWEAAYKTIVTYEAFDDQLGLLAIDQLAVDDRRRRLERLLQTRRQETEADNTIRPEPSTHDTITDEKEMKGSIPALNSTLKRRAFS